MRKIIILPFAEQDIRETVNFYKERKINLEDQFILVLDQAFQVISENPSSFPVIKHQIRKFVIRDFPFNIYYIFENEAIYILAVFHNKRNPKKWQERTKIR